jgi:hypothetical protein
MRLFFYFYFEISNSFFRVDLIFKLDVHFGIFNLFKFERVKRCFVIFFDFIFNHGCDEIFHDCEK